MDSDSRHRSQARLLAPIALVAFGVVLLLVLASGGGGSGDNGGAASSAAEKKDLGSSASERRQRRKERSSTSTTSTTKQPTEDVYVVKQGDTLAGIAENTGVSVERLQELNPGLDQFSLVAGQRIKLR
jgi:LysM repeat protein